MDHAKRLRNQQTDAEALLWSRLRNQQLGFKFRRQHLVGEYIVDFICPDRRLVIELDGGQHAERVEQDGKRTACLESVGLKVLRFWNDETLTKTDDVLEAIWQALHAELPPHPSPLPRRRGRGSRNADVSGIANASHQTAKATHSPPPAGERAGVRGGASEAWQATASLDAIRLRAQLNALIREFFHARSVLEVETPVMSVAGNTDPNIASFRVEFSGRTDGGPRTRWLRTSAEFPLKRLLAAGIGDCYELGRVFRDGEAGGRHNPEFTMLEWYRVGWDHQRLIDETVELVQVALTLVGRSAMLGKTSFRDLYHRHLGIDPLLATLDELRHAAADIAIDGEGLSRDDWLDLLMTHRLQPSFAEDRLRAVYDYPASQCALARIRDGNPPVAERFELYLGPLELANGYHELNDADEQRRRFGRDHAMRRERGDVVPPLDERLLAALPDLPDCAGVALGVDRLLMAMLQTPRIADVLAFDFSRA